MSRDVPVPGSGLGDFFFLVDDENTLECDEVYENDVVEEDAEKKERRHFSWSFSGGRCIPAPHRC